MATFPVDVTDLAARIRATAKGRSRVLVGIDGPGGAGKSMFADRLAGALGEACVVHVDDFYLPASRRQERRGEVGALFDLPRLAREVIEPAAAGSAFRYQRYDWERDALAEWVEIAAGVPVVVEGVFCLCEELRKAYTFRIWCRVAPAVRLRRGVARDGEAARSLWVEHWMPAEESYAAKQQPERYAELVLDSSRDGEFRVVAERRFDRPEGR